MKPIFLLLLVLMTSCEKNNEISSTTYTNINKYQYGSHHYIHTKSDIHDPECPCQKRND